MDVIYLNWFEISYTRLLKAVDNNLAFSVTGTGRLRFTIGDLTESGCERIRHHHSLKGGHLLRLQGVKKKGTKYQATVETDVTKEKTLLAAAESAVLSPSSLEVWTSSNLKSKTNGADYILISAGKFLSSFAPLTKYRKARGLRVKAVAVEDIYNEFNYGLTDPQAIKDFLSFAYANWKRPAPVYVLLAGDATYDYRDYFGTGKVSVVPVHLGWTSAVGITPDDNWYVAVDGGRRAAGHARREDPRVEYNDGGLHGQ